MDQSCISIKQVVEINLRKKKWLLSCSYNPNRENNLLTRSRLGLSHHCDHKFKHSFQDSLNIWNCGTDVETTTHYLLHCPLFFNERLILINNILNIDNNILNLNYFRFSEVLLFGNSSFNNTKNIFILNTTIEYIVSSKRFEVPLFDSFRYFLFIYFIFYHYYYYYYY